MINWMHSIGGSSIRCARFGNEAANYEICLNGSIRFGLLIIILVFSKCACKVCFFSNNPITASSIQTYSCHQFFIAFFRKNVVYYSTKTNKQTNIQTDTPKHPIRRIKEWGGAASEGGGGGNNSPK